MSTPAVLINCFTVPAGREDEFFAMWLEVNRYMRTRPGYLGHSLHKALAPDATYRFVNTASWESTAALAGAHDEHFRSLVSAPQWRDFPSMPGAYVTVHTGGVDDMDDAARDEAVVA